MRDVQTVFPTPHGPAHRSRHAGGGGGGGGEGGGQLLCRLNPLEERRARRLGALRPGDLSDQRGGGVKFHREGGRSQRGVAVQRRGRALRGAALRGGRRRARQGREGDVPGGLAARGAVLALQLGGQAVQRAGPDVARTGRRVGNAGAGRAALRRGSAH